jgi:FixJ family two-component response regulator
LFAKATEGRFVTRQGRIIAIVDDDPRVLESMQDLLESAGYSARTFTSARELLDAGLSDVGCLITDIGMADVDGFALNELVKKVRPDLPVFVVTGRDVVGDQQRALVAGVRGFFRKPFDGVTLLAAIGQAFETASRGGQSTI